MTYGNIMFNISKEEIMILLNNPEFRFYLGLFRRKFIDPGKPLYDLVVEVMKKIARKN